MYKRSIWTTMAHGFGGFLGALIPFISNVWVFGIVLTILFLVYEVDEDWHISDEAFIDIREYIVGFIVGGIVGLLIRRVF